MLAFCLLFLGFLPWGTWHAGMDKTFRCRNARRRHPGRCTFLVVQPGVPTPAWLRFAPSLPACLQYKFGLHRYVGQRVRLWSDEAQDWREGVITSFGQK